jgi:hypothetical protein
MLSIAGIKATLPTLTESTHKLMALAACLLAYWVVLSLIGFSGNSLNISGWPGFLLTAVFLIGLSFLVEFLKGFLNVPAWTAKYSGMALVFPAMGLTTLFTTGSAAPLFQVLVIFVAFTAMGYPEYRIELWHKAKADAEAANKPASEDEAPKAD